MNKAEYLEALRGALSGLPPEERDSAVLYYEDYFEDAGPENEQKVIEELGTPTMVAHAILSEYRDLATTPQAQEQERAKNIPPHRKGINPWLLLAIVLLAIPIGVPLLAGFAALLVGLLAVILSIAAVAVLVPFICVVVGVAVCWAGFLSLFVAPASGVYAIGGGLIAIAVGLLIGLLFLKILMLFVPPIVRGIVALCRRPFERRNQR